MYQQIGEFLKQIRSERKLSIDDVARATHIRPKYIEALETNNLDSLPSAVHGKGFLRSYASFLDLPIEPLLKAWETGVVDTSAFTEGQQLPPAHPVDSYTSEENGEVEVVSEPDSVAKTQSKSPIHKDVFTDIIPPSEKTQNDTRQDHRSQSSNIFIQIGSTLRTQREMLGLSLDDIEQYTHIRLYYLRAIEDGRLADLPSPVQAKGMTENYARFLDLDANQIMLQFADGLQAQRIEKKSESSPKSTKKKTTAARKQPAYKKFLTPDLLIGSIVIVALLIFAIWSTSQIIKKRNETTQATIPGISEVLAATSSPTEEYLILETPEGESVETLTGTSEIPSNDTTQIGVSPEATFPDENLAITVSPTFEVMVDAPLQVYIITRQRTYLKVDVDGQTVFNGRTLPGNAYPYSGTESIEVLTGNASALQIFFNQNDLGTIGAFSQVIDLIFTAQGIITPTPRFTATSTPTTPATMTLEPTATPVTPTATSIVP